MPAVAFRLVEQGVGAGVEPLDAIAADQINQALFACGAGRKLRPHISQNLTWDSNIALDDFKDGVYRLTAVIEAHGRNP